MSTASRAALSVLVVMLLWALVPPALGLRSTVVMSGSMAPAVRVGDVVVTRTPAPRAVGPGAVVLVDDPDHAGRLRLHRLVAVDDGMLRLRGDANPAPDSSPVAPEALRGVAFLRVPLVGLPMVWVAEGRWVAVGLASMATSLLLLAAGTSRLLPGDGRPRSRRRRPRVAGATAVVLLVVAAAPSPAPRQAWAAFSSATASPPAAFSAGVFDCLTALPLVSGLGAPTIAWAFAEPSGDTTADVGVSGSTARLTGSYSRVSGSCVKNDGPSVRLGAAGRGVVAASTSITSPSVLTLSVWFKASAPGGAIPSSGLIAGFGSSPDGTVDSARADRQLLLNTNGTLTFRVDALAGSSASITTPAVAQDGAWHHAVVVMNGTLGAMRIRVDGKQAAAASVSLSLSLYTAYLRLGADGPSPSTGAYRGEIGRVQLWAGVAATDAQATALYDAGR